MKPRSREVTDGDALLAVAAYPIGIFANSRDASSIRLVAAGSLVVHPAPPVPREQLTIRGGEKLTWYRSSERVSRGFCSGCGSALFWDAHGHKKIAVAMGAFDLPTEQVQPAQLQALYANEQLQTTHSSPVQPQPVHIPRC